MADLIVHSASAIIDPLDTDELAQFAAIEPSDFTDVTVARALEDECERGRWNAHAAGQALLDSLVMVEAQAQAAARVEARRRVKRGG